MTAGSAASRRVLARTPVAPLPASSPTRPVGINGRTSAPPDSSLPDVCSFQLPKVCSFRLPLTIDPSGSIPARAGETPSRTDWSSRSGVHPRACGGNRLASRPTPRLGGPSPRVRGKRSASPFCGSGQGSIPARAGETSLLPASASRMRVHPRACGGNQTGYACLKCSNGPSPRVRGKPALQGHTWCCSGSIPARAGETG